MEQISEPRRGGMRYFLPALGAAVPFGLMLMRRSRGKAQHESKEEMLLRESSVNLGGALNIALKYMPGTPVEVELEEKHGMPVWEVEIVPRKGGPTREILIDARNGDVLEMKAEFDEEMEAAA